MRRWVVLLLRRPVPQILHDHLEPIAEDQLRSNVEEGASKLMGWVAVVKSTTILRQIQFVGGDEQLAAVKVERLDSLHFPFTTLVRIRHWMGSLSVSAVRNDNRKCT